MTTEQIEFLKDIETSELLSYIKKDRHRAFISWSPDDVIDRASELGFEMSETKAKNVIYDLEHYKDCEYGITWDTVSSHIDHWIQENTFEVEIKIIGSGEQYVTKFCALNTNENIENYYLDDEYYFYGLSKVEIKSFIGKGAMIGSGIDDTIIIAVK